MSDKDEMDQVRRLLERLEKGLDPVEADGSDERERERDADPPPQSAEVAHRHVSVLTDPSRIQPTPENRLPLIVTAGAITLAALGGGTYLVAVGEWSSPLREIAARGTPTTASTEPPRTPVTGNAPSPSAVIRTPDVAPPPPLQPAAPPGEPATPPPREAPQNAAPTETDGNTGRAEHLLVEVTNDMARGRIMNARRRLEATDIADEPDLIWALARAYDPNVLSQVGTPDAAPNPERAAELYRRWHAVSVAKGLVSSDVSIDRLLNSLGLSTDDPATPPAELDRSRAN